MENFQQQLGRVEGGIDEVRGALTGALEALRCQGRSLEQIIMLLTPPDDEGKPGALEDLLTRIIHQLARQGEQLDELLERGSPAQRSGQHSSASLVS